MTVGSPESKSSVLLPIDSSSLPSRNSSDLNYLGEEL